MKTENWPTIQQQKDHWKALEKETPETPNERSQTGGDYSGDLIAKFQTSERYRVELAADIEILIDERDKAKAHAQRLADALKNVLDERVGCRVDARKVLEDWSAQ